MIGLNNKKIGFIVDTSSTIKNGDYDDVSVLPLGITVVENGTTKTFKDGVDFTTADLEKVINNKNADVKTSQANVADMMKICQDMFSKYDIIIVLPIHGKISSNINTWRMLKDDFPNLVVLMTYDIAGSFAWTLEDLREYLKTHECVEAEVQKYVDSFLNKRFGFLMVEDLSQLAKGGRVSGIKAALAKLFKIFPVIYMDYTGLKNYAKAKSNEDLFGILDKYLKETHPGKQIVRMFLIVPIGFEDIAKQYLEDYKNHYKKEPPVTYTFPSVITTHTGLKHVALYVELK